MSAGRLPRVTRRRLLTETGLALAAASAAPVISAPFVSAALADTRTLTIVVTAKGSQPGATDTTLTVTATRQSTPALPPADNLGRAR